MLDIAIFWQVRYQQDIFKQEANDKIVQETK